MPLPFRTLVLYIGALGAVGAGVLMFQSTLPTPPQGSERAETSQIASVVSVEAPAVPQSVEVIPEEPVTEPVPSPASPSPESQDVSVAARVHDPYPFPPLSFQAVNDRARAALVNVICTSGNESLRPISGSGVIIDPRGVILTNAHVAQYVMLAQSTEINLSCVIRSGAPARPMWSAEVLYIPTVWVEEHAVDITNSNPTGTGEHDYALLHITGPYDARMPDASKGSYPSIPFDVREAISFPGDLMIITAYPAEFVGSAATQFDLHPVSSISPVSELLTFHAKTVDLVSFKGAAEAQSGSSGGPIVNVWGYVTGIITTTSDGLTTAERELRAITTSYIDRDLASQTGKGLAATLSGDLQATADNFKAKHSPALIKLLIDQILKRLL
ncbi:MAG: hypothetical protein A3H71_01405 [Candidatus Sungbacteria bacterium RIFCSPLOWO2_02_FULL_48_13b]|uniref:Serine protease n=1 Tax=Candidatus Sungbacteria bacterium RIFCSPLOWO2_02_FULL_48_13b TaxID=1802283 RepID=A0A1G2LGP6_9BACT|nr:MAG: hypothetical protein A3H71_01405 [Candidatus Sungbacteria bacterium RIFCSPLOWO2_02_FULL_48_13b]